MTTALISKYPSSSPRAAGVALLEECVAGTTNRSWLTANSDTFESSRATASHGEATAGTLGRAVAAAVVLALAELAVALSTTVDDLALPFALANAAGAAALGMAEASDPLCPRAVRGSRAQAAPMSPMLRAVTTAKPGPQGRRHMLRTYCRCWSPSNGRTATLTAGGCVARTRTKQRYGSRGVCAGSPMVTSLIGLRRCPSELSQRMASQPGCAKRRCASRPSCTT